MLNLLAITKEERTALYKIIKKKTIQDTLRACNKQNIVRLYRLSYDRVEKEDVIGKAEEKLKNLNLESEEVKILVLCIEMELENHIKDYNELKALLDNRKIDELNKKEQSRLENLKESHDETKTKISFDNLVKLLCAMDETQHNFQLKGILEEKVKELEKKNSDLNSAYTNLETAMKKQNNELEKYKAIAEKYNRLQKVEEISGTVEQLIGKVDKTFESLNDVLNHLNECETIALNVQDYEKVQKILTVKYGIIKIMRG